MAEGNQQGKQNEIGKCADNCETCKLEDSIGDDWKTFLSEELKDEFNDIKHFLCGEKGNFYPKAKEIFAFTKLTKFDDIRVVIVGQDPYHTEGQAMGLAFSLPKNIQIPSNSSLKNIFKELGTDIGFKTPKSGDLTKWAQQGVLLLNSVLTVRPGEPESHYGKGWEEITNKIIEKISERDNVVFMLWGDKAHEKERFICNPTNHSILKCSHPCNQSATKTTNPFIGCKHFSKANAYLGIDWTLPVE